MNQAYRQAEAERKAAIKDVKGTIFDYNPASGLYRVADGEGWESGWMPLKVAKAGGDVFYAPLDIGEQVIVECPAGDLSQGVIAGSFYSEASPPPSASPDKMMMKFKNGTVIEHDRAGDNLDIKLPSGGTININANGGTSWIGDINIKGNVSIDGLLLVTKNTSIGQNLTVGGAIAFGTGSGGGSMIGTGNINLTGAITSTGDQVAGKAKISQVNHTHGGVEAGGASTAQPK